MLGVPLEDRPQDLPEPDQTMWDLIGGEPTITRDPGHLILQIRSDDPFINEHVIRRIERNLADRLTITWTQIGEQRYTARADDEGAEVRREARALIGFLDGTSNLRAKRRADPDYHLIFVDPANVAEYPALPDQQQAYNGGVFPPPGLRHPPSREPEWARNGTYLTVRSSVTPLDSWDAIPRAEQERVIGRFKETGSSLDRSDDTNDATLPPLFASDPTNVTVPLNSHVRKANPQRPGDELRRVLRRGYPTITSSGPTIDRGLIFICFARSISTQFEFVFRAWMDNPSFPIDNQVVGKDQLLERFDQQPVVGGYYFVPPLQRRADPTSWFIPPQGP